MYQLCWFCSSATCEDCAHLALEIILTFFAFCAIAGLILFVVYLGSCIEHTKECNELSHKNYRKCLDLEARLQALEKAAKSRFGGSSHGK